MTNEHKAELLRILRERHGIFEGCEIGDSMLGADEGLIAGRVTNSYPFDHAVVLDAVHAWLMGLHEQFQITMCSSEDVVHVTYRHGGYASFKYPLSAAIWNVLEFVLKEMGDADGH